MKEMYEMPSIEAVMIKTEEVITTSGGGMAVDPDRPESSESW